jgi:hypothetical protein
MSGRSCKDPEKRSQNAYQDHQQGHVSGRVYINDDVERDKGEF